MCNFVNLTWWFFRWIAVRQDRFEQRSMGQQKTSWNLRSWPRAQPFSITSFSLLFAKCHDQVDLRLHRDRRLLLLNLALGNFEDSKVREVLVGGKIGCTFPRPGKGNAALKSSMNCCPKVPDVVRWNGES